MEEHKKEILDRGTNWCFDITRFGAAILDCLEKTSRFFVPNPDEAYRDYVLIEFFIMTFGVVDPIYGYYFYDNALISAKVIYHSSILQL